MSPQACWSHYRQARGSNSFEWGNDFTGTDLRKSTGLRSDRHTAFIMNSHNGRSLLFLKQPLLLPASHFRVANDDSSISV